MLLPTILDYQWLLDLVLLVSLPILFLVLYSFAFISLPALMLVNLNN